MNNAISANDPGVRACYEPLAKSMIELVNSMAYTTDVRKLLDVGGYTNTRIRNGETEKPYNGINQVLLKLHEIRNGYTDPRWLTRNQILKAGGNIPAGQEPAIVSFYQFYDRETGERLPEPQRYYQEVFNIQQCEFIPGSEYSRPWVIYEQENFYNIFTEEEINLIDKVEDCFDSYCNFGDVFTYDKYQPEIITAIIEAENKKTLPSRTTVQNFPREETTTRAETVSQPSETVPASNTAATVSESETVTDRIYLNTVSSTDWNSALVNGALVDTDADKLYITPDMPVEKFMDYIDPAIFQKAPQLEQTPEQTIEQSPVQSDDVSIEHQSAETAEPQNDLRAEQPSEQTAADMRALVSKHRKQIETFIKLVTRNQGFVNSVRTKDFNSIKNDFKALAPGLMLSFETHYRDFANDVRDNKDFGEWVQTHVYHIALHEIQNKLLKAKETEKFVNTIPEQAPEFDISEKEKMTKFLAEQMAEMRKSFEESNQKTINEIKASFDNHLKTLNAEHEKQLAESRKRESELLARIAELEQQRNEQRTEKKEEPEQSESVSATSAEPEKAEQSASYDTAPVEQAEEVKPEQNRTSDVSRSESAPEKEQAFGQFSTITGIGLENFVDRDGAYHNVYTEFINELMNSETVINAVVNADEQNIKLTIEKEFINNVLTSWFEKENSEHKGERFYLGNITEIHDAITNKSGLMNDLLESFYTNITTIYKDSIIDTYNYKHGMADNANTVGKSESERFYQYLNSYINTYVGKSRVDYRFRTWESDKKEQDSAFKFMQDYLTKHFGNYVVESGDVFGNSKREIDFNDGIVKFRTELKSVVFYRNFLESFLKSDKADIRFERSDNGVIIYDKSMDLLLHTIFTNTINDVEQSFKKEEKINTKRPKPAHSTETQNEQQELFGTGSGTESEQKTEQASPDVSQSAHDPEQKEPEQVQEQTAARSAPSNTENTTKNPEQSVKSTFQSETKDEREQFYKYLNSFINTVVGRDNGYHNGETWYWNDKTAFNHIHDYINKNLKNVVVPVGKNGTERQLEFDDGIIKFRARDNDVYIKFVEDFLSCGKAKIEFSVSDESDIRLNRYMFDNIRPIFNDVCRQRLDEHLQEKHSHKNTSTSTPAPSVSRSESATTVSDPGLEKSAARAETVSQSSETVPAADSTETVSQSSETVPAADSTETVSQSSETVPAADSTETVGESESVNNEPVKKTYTASPIPPKPAPAPEVPYSEREFEDLDKSGNIKIDLNENRSDNEFYRFQKNIDAIRVVKQLNEENRDATPEEKETLRQFTGWGGLASRFNSYEGKVLKDLLTEQEYYDAVSSSATAYYTDPEIANLMYEKLEEMGLKGGTILEPSCGTGNFIGSVPENIRNKCKFVGVELDTITGQIAKHLYQSERVFNTGFENIKGENLFDAVIGNVPFDNCTVVDEDFKKENFSIHNYFIAKSLRLCKPGGVVALITSHNTLDSKSSLHREWIAQRGELLGAVRLPKDAFKHSGTSVVTDILFIKKRERMLTKEEARKEEWVNAKQVVMEYKKNSKTEEIEKNKNGEPIVAEDVYINSYFADGNHAENVAGNIRFDKGKFGYEVFCEHEESDDKIELIKDSLKSISGTMEPIGKEQEISNASLLMNEKLMKIVDGLKDDEDKENIANYFVEDPNVKLDSFDPPLKSEKDYALFNSMTFMFLKDGSIRYHAGNGIFYKIEGAPKEDIETLTDIIKIRDIAKDYLNMQAEKRPEEELNNQQKLLNETYDRFCRKRGTDYITGKKKTHKHVNATLVGYRYNFTEHLDSDDKKNNTVEKNFTKLFSCDSQMSFIMALEKRGKYNRRAKTINKYGEYLGKSDIFTTRTVRETKEIEHVDSPQDALKVSMGYHGKVDFPYMAKLLGMKQNSESYDKIIESLKGEIFLEPDKLTILNKSIKFEDDTQDYIMDNTYKSYVIASEYLSGNVFQKIKRAEEMGLSENVNALMEVKPAYIKGEQIICDIGQNWIPADIYTKFVKEVIFPDCNNIKRDNDFRVEFNEFTNKVELLIPDKRAIKSEMAQSGSLSTTEYGTSNLHAGDILESLFNKHGLGLNVKKKIVDRETGRPVNVVDEVATKEVDIARQKIEKRFKEWLIEDPERKEQIEKVYNERFNSNVPRKFDGKILNFDGMNPDIKLREHQIDAVARQIYGGNTLLHHEVGAGKTFEMIAAAMESKRIGVCSKPVIAVPPHLVKQTEEEFRRLYPNANLIVQTDNDNKLGNRQKFFANIAMSNCDCIIMSHNMFSKYLPMSKEYANNTFLKEYERLEVAYNEAEMREGKKGNTVKAIKEKIKKLEKRYKKFLDKNSNSTDITFEETGIDRIFIDEAHIYKNLDTITTLSSLPGVCTNGNDATFDMKMKCEYLDRISDSKAITFATGTPVTNSMTEMFTMMRYLNQKGLDEQYIGDFDQWISIYGNIEEIKRINLLGTEFESRTELTNFKNTPELLTSYHMFADVKTEKDLQLPKPEAEFHTIATKPSSLQQEVIDTFVVRAETIKAGHVNPKVDNFLKLTHDGRQLGLDQRAYNPEFPDDPNSKVNACVENLIRIYNDTADQKSTQLVFCDQCTPKPKKKKVKEEEHEHKEEIIQNTSTERSSENEEDTELENPDERDVEIVNKFDVYADIKKKLIAGGVKEEEIAFIHDYNNADKKQELFDKVNKGEVRILLGSTAKMGAGTNVQKKLIALHHLDVTWKAADLTQRNGRALRQGNDNEKVDIYTYVTENTFDTYIFQKNQRKAEFMEQIMHNECHVREFDDIGELSLQCADIKACCLGDSRIREKVDLENELNKLELEQAAFKHTQAVVRDRVETLPKNIESHKKSIEKLNNDIDVLNKHPLPKNGFVGITISGVHYSERKDANAAILKEVKNFNFRDVKEKEIGSYRGFKVILSHKVSDNGDLPYIILQSSEKGARHGTTDLGAFESSDNMSRIENKLSKIPDQLEMYKFSIEQKTKELEVYKSKIVDVWDKQEELEKVKANLIRVTNELEKDEQDDLDNDPNEVDTELESSVNPVEEFRHELKDSVSRNGIKELLEKNPELAEKVMGLMEKVERREQAQAAPVPEQKQDESRTFRR